MMRMWPPSSTGSLQQLINQVQTDRASRRGETQPSCADSPESWAMRRAHQLLG